jgi:hypothetical protein
MVRAEPPAARLVVRVRVLSEAEWHRLFDKYNPPPLPPHAFCRGEWRSPLV